MKQEKYVSSLPLGNVAVEAHLVLCAVPPNAPQVRRVRYIYEVRRADPRSDEYVMVPRCMVSPLGRLLLHLQ
jgi:hypothetical protein